MPDNQNPYAPRALEGPFAADLIPQIEPTQPSGFPSGAQKGLNIVTNFLGGFEKGRAMKLARDEMKMHEARQDAYQTLQLALTNPYLQVEQKNKSLAAYMALAGPQTQEHLATAAKEHKGTQHGHIFAGLSSLAESFTGAKQDKKLKADENAYRAFNVETSKILQDPKLTIGAATAPLQAMVAKVMKDPTVRTEDEALRRAGAIFDTWRDIDPNGAAASQEQFNKFASSLPKVGTPADYATRPPETRDVPGFTPVQTGAGVIPAYTPRKVEMERGLSYMLSSSPKGSVKEETRWHNDKPEAVWVFGAGSPYAGKIMNASGREVDPADYQLRQRDPQKASDQRMVDWYTKNDITTYQQLAREGHREQFQLNLKAVDHEFQLNMAQLREDWQRDRSAAAADDRYTKSKASLEQSNRARSAAIASSPNLTPTERDNVAGENSASFYNSMQDLDAGHQEAMKRLRGAGGQGKAAGGAETAPPASRKGPQKVYLPDLGEKVRIRE